MGYKVKLDIFEGPFDLLVYLIENAEMNIYDIQVSKITDQYLEYLKQMKSMDVALATEFMVLAAALIEIKSKMLLPRLVTEDGSFEAEDPRTDLVNKLLEYKRFKMAAENLEAREEEYMKICEKPKEDISQYTNEPDEYLNLDLRQFVSAFNLFLHKKKKMEEIKKNYQKVERQKATIESKIEYIAKYFQGNEENLVTFSELVARRDDSYEVVLTFVSLLEMVRQKLIDINQNTLFGTIEVRMKEGAQNDNKEIN